MLRKKQKNKKIPDNELVFYQSSDGAVHVEVMFTEKDIWLNQSAIADLFRCSIDNISLHLKNLYKSKEIEEGATVEDFSTVQTEGERVIKRTKKFYNLEAIIAVGYKVNSKRGIEFRKWATQILKSYIHKGYVLDSDRMKYGSRFSMRYFDELYEEIKDIRTSERMMYQKITDIYATSFDYSLNTAETKVFFATVQNKLHFAITGQTAAEIVSTRVDSKKNKMGLTTWRQSPKGKIMPSDVSIAKNFLKKKELKELNRIGNMYLDYAEHQAEKGIPMNMRDWSKKLDAFLQFNEHKVLTHIGKVSHEEAEKLALQEYTKFKPRQDKSHLSDFDKEIKKLNTKYNNA